MLRLISYLAPSIPASFYQAVADAINSATGLEVELKFEERISGPLPGDANPFVNGEGDVGFVCVPTYRWFREGLELLPLPVPCDIRSQGRAVYFADVAVHEDSTIQSFADLRGRCWAYNDRNSLSGWFSMVEHIAPEQPHDFFGDLRQAGSHLDSLRLLLSGEVDAAGIDSNALLYYLKQEGKCNLRIIESLGPFPIQPVVIRSSINTDIKQAVRMALLNAHNRFGTQFKSFGFERFIEANDVVYD